MTHGWWRKERPEAEWKVYEDFRVFLWMVWKILGLPDPTPLQYDIAHYLQHAPDRVIIQAFRGIGKSYVTAAFVVWCLLRFPDTKILVVSASEDYAKEISGFIKSLIRDIPMCRHLLARAEQRDSVLSFDVGPAKTDKTPSVRCRGITGQLTGGRADIILADDIEVPNNSETQTRREKMAELVKEFDAIIKPLPTCRIIYLGTPQCEDSLYGKLLNRGYTTRVWPARFPKQADLPRIERFLAPVLLDAVRERPELSASPRYGGRAAPTDTRFSHEDLMRRELSYGKSGFALQYMLDTRLSDAERFPLKLSDLVVMDLNPEVAPERIIWGGSPDLTLKELPCVGLDGDRYKRPAVVMGDYVDYQAAVMFVDPAGRGADETAYAVVKMLNGFLFLTAAGGLQGGYTDEVLTRLCEIARDHKVNRILIESNFGDGMFEHLMKPHLGRIYPCTTEGIRSNKQKELRIIDTLEPVMNQHRLVVDPGVIEDDYASVSAFPEEVAYKYRLFYQLSRITREKGALTHDDRLDALAGAVAFWQEQMGLDAERKQRERKDRMLELELRVFEGKAGATIDQLALGMSPEQMIRSANRRRGKRWA